MLVTTDINRVDGSTHIFLDRDLALFRASSPTLYKSLWEIRDSDYWEKHARDSFRVSRTKDGWLYGTDYILSWESQDIIRPGVSGDYWVCTVTGKPLLAEKIDWMYEQLKYLFL